MELEIIRTYYPKGTNGVLYVDGVLQCFTIELPWLNNQRRCSCIPEGRYRIKSRYTPRYGHHLEVLEVPQRDSILVHPANFALKELAGCIAPVSQLTGAGRGIQSKAAFEWLLEVVYPSLRKEAVFLTLKTKANDPTPVLKTKNTGAHAPVL